MLFVSLFPGVVAFRGKTWQCKQRCQPRRYRTTYTAS